LILAKNTIPIDISQRFFTGYIMRFSHLIIITLVTFTLAFANTKDSSAQNRKPSACTPRAASLIVLNFTSEPIRVFVNNKAIGRVPLLDQKRFQRALPVGSNQVSARTKSGIVIQNLEPITVTDTGTRTCSQSRVFTVGSMSAQ
jgi:hypothetical protein